MLFIGGFIAGGVVTFAFNRYAKDRVVAWINKVITSIGAS